MADGKTRGVIAMTMLMDDDRARGREMGGLGSGDRSAVDGDGSGRSMSTGVRTLDLRFAGARAPFAQRMTRRTRSPV